MCRDVTIDFVHAKRVACFDSWTIGLWTHQPVLMAQAKQEYVNFIFYLFSCGEISKKQHEMYLTDWREECARIEEEFNNGS